MQYSFTQQQHGDFHFFPPLLMAFPSALTTDSGVSGTHRTPDSSGELGLHLFLISSSSRCFSSKAELLAEHSSENSAAACWTAVWNQQDPCEQKRQEVHSPVHFPNSQQQTILCFLPTSQRIFCWCFLVLWVRRRGKEEWTFLAAAVLSRSPIPLFQLGWPSWCFPRSAFQILFPLHLI